MNKLFAYHEEHLGRIINLSHLTLDLNYLLCEYTKKKNSPMETKCTDIQELIPALGQGTHFIELNLDKIVNLKPDSPQSFSLSQRISVKQITADGYTTLFRINDKDEDNQEQPLHKSCYMDKATQSIVLTTYNGHEFYCKLG